METPRYTLSVYLHSSIVLLFLALIWLHDISSFHFPLPYSLVLCAIFPLAYPQSLSFVVLFALPLLWCCPTLASFFLPFLVVLCCWIVMTRHLFLSLLLYLLRCSLALLGLDSVLVACFYILSFYPLIHLSLLCSFGSFLSAPIACLTFFGLPVVAA